MPNPLLALILVAHASLPGTAFQAPVRRTPIVVAPPPAERPLTSNPAAFRAWLRSKIAADLVKLDESTRRLLRSLDGDVDRKQADQEARRIIKIAHNLWYNVQMRRTARKRPKLDERPAPRPIELARGDGIQLRQMLDKIARALVAQERSRAIDVRRQTEMLETLEAVQTMANQIAADVRSPN